MAELNVNDFSADSEHVLARMLFTLLTLNEPRRVGLV